MEHRSEIENRVARCYYPFKVLPSLMSLMFDHSENKLETK